MPSTKPFPEAWYASNHAWQAGSTFTTYTGTQVTINSVSTTSASVTIFADPKLTAKIRFSAGDFDGDRLADVLSREADGSLMLYAGLPGNRLDNPRKIGSGWNIFDAITGIADFNGDRRGGDILARTSDGVLWLYPGDGNGGFLAKRQVGSGWQGFSNLIGMGDFDGDARPDVMATKPDGTLWLYPSDGQGGVSVHGRRSARAGTASPALLPTAPSAVPERDCSQGPATALSTCTPAMVGGVVSCRASPSEVAGMPWATSWRARLHG